MKTLTLKAPAKINLYLDVLCKRKDNYHQIESVVQSINVYDTLHFEKINKGIRVICHHPCVYSNEHNLVYKTAELFFNLTHLPPGVKVTVQKEIPVGAGLGGGSTDAAATLLGLNILFETEIPLSELMKWSTRIGTDIPFCIRRGTALLKGKGDEVHPLPSIKEGWIVLVYPNISISTSWAYAHISRRLTNERPGATLSITDLRKRIQSKQLQGLGDLFYNKLEEVVIEEFPLIGEIKEKFKKRGAQSVVMSGSGSTVFALAENERDARKLAHYMQSSGKVYLAQPMNDNVSKED